MLKWIKSKGKKYKEKEEIDPTVKDDYDHYLCQLPDNIGALSNFILKLFGSGVKGIREQTLDLNRLQNEGIVIYVTKYKSYFRYLFYYTRYKQDRLPFPQIAFDYSVVIWQPISRIWKIVFSHIKYFFRNFGWPDPYQRGYFQKEL